MSQGPLLVRSVSAHMVTPQWAARVVSPLHDVLTETERRKILANNPDSYLHVTSDPLALIEPPGEGATESVQARALQRLLESGAYLPVPEPAVFVYRMSDRGREHTGVIASVAVAGCNDGRVLGHEAVQSERVAGLVRHYGQVSKRSELVTLFHPVDSLVAELTARVVAQPALLDFTDSSGVTQSVWRAGPAEAAVLARQLSNHRLYVADGHHRLAAATTCWERDGQPESGAVLCALYPQDHIALHAFHRRVRGPVALPALLDGLGTRFDIAPARDLGVGPGTIGMYADGRWCVLHPREPRRLPGVAGLDVTMLHEEVLLPLLGIDCNSPRLEFVPDLRDLGATMRECDAEQGIVFALHAPDIEELISVAERHEVMSPKTTYVQPKPRTGIFLSS